ncbi:MAG: Glycosyl transferase, family 2, partial [Candidatus Daviesbacteria bacterium GW2011_GWB1_39_5]
MTNNDSSRNTKDVYLTSKGLLESKEELEYLKKTKRAQIAEKIHQAREYGDLAENSEYDTAMEDQAMRDLNYLGNKFFSWAFSYLLGQKIKDTLCGTKVLTKTHYKKIEKNR